MKLINHNKRVDGGACAEKSAVWRLLPYRDRSGTCALDPLLTRSPRHRRMAAIGASARSQGVNSTAEMESTIFFRKSEFHGIVAV